VTMATVAPRMRHYIWADGRGALAQGPVDVDIGAGCFEAVEIEIQFGRDYPRVPPRFFDLARRWRPNQDRHLMANHEFCLWLAHVDTPDLNRTEGLRELLLRLIVFLRDQFVFDDLQRWPGPDWRHGERAAYAQHVLETLRIADVKSFRELWPLVLGTSHQTSARCPCGSGLPYGRCHRAEVSSLRWLASMPVRTRIPGAVEGQLRDAA
jgi:ubiquitin-protein ligase